MAIDRYGPVALVAGASEGLNGVDELVSCAGAVRTPGFAAQNAGADPPGTLDARDVARATLAAVGRGPRVVPGWLNGLAQWAVGRLLPRRHAIALMEQNTRQLC